ALESLSLRIPPCAHVAIVGPNGSGKSTLLRAIAGLVRLRRGEVRLSRGGSEVRPSIGYVPQRKSLDLRFPALSIELVASGILRRWPAKVGGHLAAESQRALERVGAGHLASRSVALLSGGELQRVLLARALAKQAELLLLDEPDTGIDAEGEEAVLKALDDLRQSGGATILTVTHDLDLALHHADRCIVLNRRVLFDGSPLDPGLREALGMAFGHGRHSHPVP
ncbi:MAG: ATP-binding cassette domain-containing protein, partial [Fimbriimonadales bacterium]|nr:ATP-binding cassette domain-containing protein [Fimbriimonadales bacterium]